MLADRESYQAGIATGEEVVEIYQSSPIELEPTKISGDSRRDETPSFRADMSTCS